MTHPIDDATLRDEVRQWLAENWTREIAEELQNEKATHYTASAARRRWLARVFDARWSAPRWPEEWFGRALSNDQAKIIEREFARVKAPGTGQDRTNLWANTLLASGQPGLKEKLVGPLLKSEVDMCLLYSEPGAGSGPRRHPHPCGRTRRRVPRERAEGLDVGGDDRRLRHADRPHELGRPEARRHQLLLLSHEAGGHRGPPPSPDHRRESLQRGFPHGRDRARGEHAREARRRMARAQHRPRLRALSNGRVRAGLPCAIQRRARRAAAHRPRAGRGPSGTSPICGSRSLRRSRIGG